MQEDSAPRRPVPSCLVKQRSRVDVDHDGKLDTLLWTRCGPDRPEEIEDTTLYPTDTFVITTATGSIPVYDNLHRAAEEHLAEVSVLPLSAVDVRVLLKVVAYAGEHVRLWQLIDVVDGAPRRWLAPSLTRAFTRLLRAHETLAEHPGPRLTATSDCIEVAQAIAREGDEDCCPSGGEVKACLVPSADGLRVGSAWRAAQ